MKKGKVKGILKMVLSTCVIIIILSGMALATDRNVIVGFKKSVGQDEDNIIANHGGIAKKNFHVIRAVAAIISDKKILELKNDPRVAYVEEERSYKASDEYSNSWGVQHIGSQLVHNQNINGTGVKIAILDTGIDYNHPDLAENYKGGYDFIYGDSDPFDYNGHGTHISGIIAAKNNGVGVIGVAPNSNIYAVSVLSPYGDGTTSLIISGIEWAVDNHMDIVTMSFSCTPNTFLPPCDDPALHNAVDNAYNSGLLLVAAGGNTYGGEVRYPAAYDSVIAVTATDQDDKNAIFSPINSKIELSAPGVAILSTVPTGTCAWCDPSGYRYLSGTSQATPHVTGVAALINSTDFPDINNDGVKNNKDIRLILDNTAKDLGIVGRDAIYGFGIVDVSNATLGYTSIDLSITKDDNISTIVAGDGKIYTYNITVKNNGPSDTSDVKIFDIWPIGFKRGTIIPSQGTCDNSNNFTCDLGSLVKGGTITITANYTVPITSIGNYTNRVEVNSSINDYNTNNNIAEDINTVIKLLVLVKTEDDNDEKKVTLLKGNYLITINNVNLTRIDKQVYQNGKLRKDLSAKYRLNNNQVINFNMDIEVPELDMVFIPHGYEGSTGSISIRRLQ